LIVASSSPGQEVQRFLLGEYAYVHRCPIRGDLVLVAGYDHLTASGGGQETANGVYVGVVNRVGFETGDIRGNSAPGKGLEFWGGSFFCDPFGRVVAEASHDKEEILLGEVDLRHLEDIRRNWPFLRDRRIDAYAPITSRMIDGK